MHPRSLLRFDVGVEILSPNWRPITDLHHIIDVMLYDGIEMGKGAEGDGGRHAWEYCDRYEHLLALIEGERNKDEIGGLSW